MTIQLIINELKREGVNSKQRVIDKLENLTLEELRTPKPEPKPSPFENTPKNSVIDDDLPF